MPRFFPRFSSAWRMPRSCWHPERRLRLGGRKDCGRFPKRLYKYKDSVFPYNVHQSGRIMTVHAELCDQPGVLSGVLSAFAAAGANIQTVNQNIPVEGKALVSISARIDRLNIPVEEFVRTLSEAEGVERITRITHEES